MKWMFFIFCLTVCTQSVCAEPSGRLVEPNQEDVIFEMKFLSVIEKGDLKSAQTFVELGADPNTKYLSGKTALMIAAERGDLPMIKFLVSKGADKKAIFKAAASSKPQTARDIAIAGGKTAAADALR